MPLFSPQVRLKSLVPMCRQLSTAYDAGIPVARALEMAARDARDARLREVLTRMRAQIGQGATLEEAARAETRYLPTFVVEVMAAGESGGKLDAMFADLADYYEDRQKMRRAFLAATAYPALVVTFAWFAGTFALGIVRRLGAAFESGRFSFAEYLAHYAGFQFVALLVLAAVAVAAIVLSRAGVLGWVTGIVSTFVWPFRPVVLRFALARFFRTLALLIEAGLPIHRAIERAAAVVKNPYIERDLLKAVPRVQRGESVTEAFSRSVHLLPDAREMLRVGEETGTMDVPLRKVSGYYLDQASTAVKIMASVLFVAVMVGTGVLVGAIIISFYASYFEAISNVIS
jgi:type IV pilus assembly protein PilC